ncbi:hypothetical protein PF007_g30125 [Phytophthora fragariae]|uniref:Uncharacterized protein n=1 Tax=Phytophthora fragariae TaxID=53985 RepID=A0A6A3Q1H9_9STRA|nr:hypothetical protein PF009_g29636 [Phytophthora fragariae]KAE9061817.1 hypothetical protein PF007_g30125 [Phytophthora fragariae]KAE9066864.1 hypothetical protein PF006_g30120 [Phytophthora fragariae]
MRALFCLVQTQSTFRAQSSSCTPSSSPSAACRTATRSARTGCAPSTEGQPH